MNEKIPAGDINAKSGFGRWLDNYWYHHKVKTIIILVAVIVVVICTLQMCSSESGDINLLYAGRFLMTSGEHERVRDVFNSVMPKDYNSDGKKYTDIITYHIMTEEQQKEYAQVVGSVNSSYFVQEYDNYTNLLLTGECSIYFLEPWLFENLVKNDRLQKLGDILEKIPAAAINDYGVRLGDTELYRQNEDLHVLPEDTVICLLKPYIFGESSKEKTYNKSIEMFAAIVGYGSES